MAEQLSTLPVDPACGQPREHSLIRVLQTDPVAEEKPLTLAANPACGQPSGSNASMCSGASTGVPEGGRCLPSHLMPPTSPVAVATKARFAKTLQSALKRDLLLDASNGSAPTTGTAIDSSSFGENDGARKPPLLPRRQFVRLKSKRRSVPHFQETPKSTILQLLCHFMMQLNLRGDVCCFRHIALQVLQRRVSEMMKWNCGATGNLGPNDDWQCWSCLLLHNDDRDGEGERVCSLCLSSSQDVDVDTETLPAEEHSSGELADNEERARTVATSFTSSESSGELPDDKSLMSH